MQWSEIAWHWLGSLSLPHVILAYASICDLDILQILSSTPLAPSSSLTSFAHLTWKSHSLALALSSQSWPDLLPQQTCRAGQAALSSLPVLLGTVNWCPLLSHVAQSQLSHGRLKPAPAIPVTTFCPLPLPTPYFERRTHSLATLNRAPWSKASVWVISVGPAPSGVPGTQAALNQGLLEETDYAKRFRHWPCCILGWCHVAAAGRSHIPVQTGIGTTANSECVTQARPSGTLAIHISLIGSLCSLALLLPTWTL